ncbi:acyl-CoA dehydrogenase family protein [Ilumatobacter sp.]|uniref:acyl-CoA dehydrogenase family protein n=1 Tax=Ilumatobacter sp. TaxID=1967498 RepID=UPI003AF6397C
MSSFDSDTTIEAMLDLRHPRKMDAATWAHELDDHVDGFDRERWRRAAARGVQALTVPKEFGGDAVSGVEAMLTFEGLGLGCSDNGSVFALASQVFPGQMSIARFGSPEQQERWLPGLGDGSLVSAFAMSEPDAGSDTSAITTTATELDDGTFRLDGEKSWVTLGPVCDIVIVFATTDPEGGWWGLTAFVVEAGTPGFDRGEVEAKLGLRSCPFGRLRFDGCVVGPEHVLGGVGAGGSVFSAAVEAERAFLYAAQLGAMERVLDRTIERARGREQFGRPIGGFQAVSHRIVEMKLRHEASRLLLYSAAARHDRGESVALPAALAKLQTSENAVQSALDAVRIHGAEGYTEACGIEAELRDAIGGLAYSGTSEIQRNIVARLLKVDRPVRPRPVPPSSDT